MKIAKIVVLVAVSCLFVFSCTQTDQPAANSTNITNAKPVPPAPSATVDSTAIAAEIYAANCAICHRDTGKGGKLTLEGKTINPEDLTADKIKKMTDEKLIGYVTNGIEDEGMPAFKDKLSADEIKQAVAHVRALQSR